MGITVRPHASVADGIAAPCDCPLGFHHQADDEPLIEFEEGEPIRRIGRHPYCVGACTIWGTPTEEFDFTLATGRRLSPRRIATGTRVTDHANYDLQEICWDADVVATCTTLGTSRLASHRMRVKRAES